VIPKPERRTRRKRSQSKGTEEKIKYYAADAEEYDMPRSNRSKKSSNRRQSDPYQTPENNSFGGMQFEQENEDHSQHEK
jgi:hypothetical protein